MEVKKLKEIIYTSSDKDLLKFIKREFEQEGSISPHNYRNNIGTLKKLDQDTIITGIARMDRIVEGTDILPSLPVLVGIFLALITSNNLFNDIIYLNFISSSLLYGFLIVLVSNEIFQTKKKKVTAIYFKKLLELIRETERID